MSIAFPLVLWLLMALTRFRSQSWLLSTLLGFFAVISSFWATLISKDYPMWAYLGPFERSYQLLFGGMVSCLTLIIDFPSYKDSKIFSGFTYFGIFGFLILGIDFGFDAIQVGMISCALTVTLLISLEANPNGYIGRFLSHPILRKMGDLSYGVYLFHYPIIIIGDGIGFPISQPLRAILLIFLSCMCAFPANKLIEEPFRKFSTDRKGLFIDIGLICSILIALFSWNLLLGNKMVQELYNNAQGITNSQTDLEVNLPVSNELLNSPSFIHSSSPLSKNGGNGLNSPLSNSPTSD